MLYVFVTKIFIYSATMHLQKGDVEVWYWCGKKYLLLFSKYANINYTWIKKLKFKCKTINHQEVNIGHLKNDFDFSKDFLILKVKVINTYSMKRFPLKK